MKDKPWYKEGEMIVAICALFISVISLGTMVYETSLQRETQKATVWPQLDISYEKMNGAFAVVVTNSGVGPAIVQSYKVKHNGEYQKDWNTLFKKINKGQDVNGSVHSYVLSRTISANQVVKNIYLSPSEESRLISANANLNIEICYCSILQDCWIRTNDQFTSKSVESCPKVDNTTFMQ